MRLRYMGMTTVHETFLCLERGQGENADAEAHAPSSRILLNVVGEEGEVVVHLCHRQSYVADVCPRRPQALLAR